jgi:sec-independent protein translocase protein TatB
VFFGLTIEKLLLIGVIAALIIGPERLPAAAESLRRAIVHVRGLARTAHERAREELGPEVADIDWQRLDPRQYDPRRIIREALLADPEPTVAPAQAPAPAPAQAQGQAQAPAPASGGGSSGSAGEPVAADQGETEPPAARAETVRSAVSTRRTAE